MSDDTLLSKGHRLSNEATALLNATPSLEDQKRASKMLEKAADHFQQAQSGVTDQGALTTLKLLVTQNRRQAKDVERRLASPQEAVKGDVPTARDVEGGVGSSGGRGKNAGSPSSRRRRPLVSTITRHAPIPPFANLATSDPQITAGNSPLHASSSSSSERGDGSFVQFGSTLDPDDPFARFWNVLENALHDISNPVAFASLPLATAEAQRESGGEEWKRSKGRRKGKEVVLDRQKSAENVSSGAESFYLVGKEDDRVALPSALSVGASGSGSLSTLLAKSTPVPKTLEELVLENTGLRSSLDAISTHAQKLEMELKMVKQREEKKEDMMKSVVLGVRREAQKVMQSQELFRSQMLAASHISSPSTRGFATLNSNPATISRSRAPLAIPPSGSPEMGVDALKARVAELEAQVGVLQLENGGLKTHLQKYRDRFEKLKTTARAKRDAKLTAGGGTRSSLDAVGEEGEAEL